MRVPLGDVAGKAVDMSSQDNREENSRMANEELQYKWSVTTREAYGDTAKDRVKSAIANLNADDIPIGRVCVIGCQQGYELEALRSADIEYVGIDCVAKFVDVCTSKGLDAIKCDAENLSDAITGKYNFYACHCLEHMYDLPLVLDNIDRHLDDWIGVEIPIEHGLVKDKAHLHPFKSVEHAREVFSRLFDIHSDVFCKSKTRDGGTYRAILRKRANQ
jgi:hypothetical protein